MENVRHSPIRKVLATPSPGAVTELLRAWGGGDDDALERLPPLVEAELRCLARGPMHRERRVSPDTVKRDWRLAKLWLLRELEGEAR